VPRELVEAVRDKIAPCVNGIGGMLGPVVEFQVRVDERGVPVKVLVDGPRYQADAVFRRVADAGWRAFENKRCQPLPIGLYSGEIDRMWFVFRFDPKEY